MFFLLRVCIFRPLILATFWVGGLRERLVGLVYTMHRLEAYYPIIILLFCVHGIDGITSLDVMLC